MIYTMTIPVLKQPCSRLIPPMVSNPISRRGLTVEGPPALRRSQGATGPSSNQVGTDLNGFFRWEMISIWESNRDYHEHGDLMVISWWFNGDEWWLESDDKMKMMVYICLYEYWDSMVMDSHIYSPHIISLIFLSFSIMKMVISWWFKGGIMRMNGDVARTSGGLENIFLVISESKLEV